MNSPNSEKPLVMKFSNVPFAYSSIDLCVIPLNKVNLQKLVVPMLSLFEGSTVFISNIADGAVGPILSDLGGVAKVM